MKRMPLDPQAAQILALKALEYIFQDEERLERFLRLTGSTHDTLRAQAGDPAFLGGVFDHILSDETLMFQFCEYADIPADQPAAARRQLP